MFALDVRAHVGSVTVKWWPEAKIVTVEPHSESFDIGAQHDPHSCAAAAANQCHPCYIDFGVSVPAITAQALWERRAEFGITDVDTHPERFESTIPLAPAASTSSPQLPRLLNLDAIKRTICDGVTQGAFGYASKDASGNIKLEKLHESLFDSDVDIADDVYIIKEADARKLQEPPRLVKLVVRPEQVVLKTGEQASFSCTAVDQYGQPFAVPTIKWSGTGGEVTPDGFFTAGETGGLYTVRADAEGQEARAEVRITTKDDPTPSQPPPGEHVIRWRGEVPAQKWMNFYTKVLSKYATSPNLKLEVSFSAKVDREHADAKAGETKSALRELGLDDDIGPT